MTDASLPAPRLPVRPDDGHKGTFGTVMVVGGAAEPGGGKMIGAPALAALGALRAGAGLAKLVCPPDVLTQAMAIAPSATGLALPTDGRGAIVTHEAAALLDEMLESASALVIGPGLGGGASSPDAIQSGVEAIALRSVQQDRVPVVVDADAINALARVPDLAREIRGPVVMTPHPGEFRRLGEALRLSQDPAAPDQRPLAAQALAQRLGCVVVLKGARTVVSDGLRTWVCDAGHACMGTAGTGDVLAGVLAGLIAQHVRPVDPLVAKLPQEARRALGGQTHADVDLFDAARAAVLAHALAGERWATRHDATGGMLASELADLIPPCVESLRRRSPGEPLS